jgi:hypothetical protein
MKRVGIRVIDGMIEASFKKSFKFVPVLTGLHRMTLSPLRFVKGAA